MGYANIRLQTWRNYVPAWAKNSYQRFRTRILIAPMLRRGWRPSGAIPLDPQYFEASYGYDDEEPIKAALSAVHAYSHTSFERLATLWLQVRYLDRYRIPGALMECGVWKGGAVGLMALAHMHANAEPFRDLHLFDSFEGLPEPRADVDGALAVEIAERFTTGNLQPIGQLAASPLDSKALLLNRIGYPERLVHYHIGWFQNTLPQDVDSIGEIALLRLDGDWYESTKVCLQHLYPKVVSAGVIVIDDYGHFAGCRRAVDEFLGSQSAPIMLHHIDCTGRYWLKP
jgi:O-methyltransferase